MVVALCPRAHINGFWAQPQEIPTLDCFFPLLTIVAPFQRSDLLTLYPTQLNPPLRTMSSLAAVGLRSARRPMLRNVQTVGRRFAHADPNYNMPFNYTTTSRRAFAVKAFTFMGTAFTIPFIAIWWHWNRPGGIKNPVN
ncbi:hypothetical protein NMY22_g11845 [Coprinellus aureogranulatus]|nr:hypothetical protein NMY22_g11845 [Coprinellus aureogranulatus]